VAIRRCNPLEVAAMTILAKCPQFAQKHEAASLLQFVSPQLEPAHSKTTASGVWSAIDDGVAKTAAAAKAASAMRRPITLDP